jgi:hypothetical protein
MTARMETASRQYGVMILLTDDFFKVRRSLAGCVRCMGADGTVVLTCSPPYKLLSKAGQSVVRKLDVVTVKGSQVKNTVSLQARSAAFSWSTYFLATGSDAHIYLRYPRDR